jgi:hypothetical protein
MVPEVPDHKEKAMTVKHKVAVSIDRPTRRPTATQRRAALTAAIAGQQQNLKREAAERRAKRARDDTQPGHADATSIPRSQASERLVRSCQ